MVRLVFHPYTQVCWSICTSESLWASTRVSSGFALLKHSSPFFGFQQVCSYSNVSRSRIGQSVTRSLLRGYLTSVAKQPLPFTFIVPAGGSRWVGQDGLHEIIWPSTTLAQCVNSMPQFKPTACKVKIKLGRERPAQKSMCWDSSVGSEFAHHKL